MKKVNKIVLLIISFCIVVIPILYSCDTKASIHETSFVPEAANQFAFDKETETTAIEETKAHHIYGEIKLPAETEVVIGEREFLTRINHIRNNIDRFANSSIIIEGMYGFYESWDNTFRFPMVYRNGPGCCGDDQYGGFYLINLDMEAYEIDDWVRVKGKPFMYDHTDSEGETTKYMFLLVESIEVLPLKERKAEMVND